MKKLLIAMILVIAVILPIHCLSFDQVKPEKDVIAVDYNASFSYVRIVALGTAYGFSVDYRNRSGYKLREGFWMQGGSGTVVAAGYVVTCAHVVRPSVIEIAEGKTLSRITDTFAMLSRTVYLLDYKNTPIVGVVIYEDKESDLALIRYNHRDAGWLKPIPYLIEYTAWNELKKGDVVVGVLHGRSTESCDYGEITDDVRLRYGTVTDPQPNGRGNNMLQAWLNVFDMTISLPILPGDSGSPLFAFRGGKPVMIGILRAYAFSYPEIQSSYAVRLVVVHKLINTMRGKYRW